VLHVLREIAVPKVFVVWGGAQIPVPLYHGKLGDVAQSCKLRTGWRQESPILATLECERWLILMPVVLAASGALRILAAQAKELEQQLVEFRLHSWPAVGPKPH
jgi:hypothetical protein